MRASGWLADAARFWVALAVWNTRKTSFILQGRAGHCPCHDPSDSGLPGQTRCEPALHWDSPGRFRRVCPLLKQEAAGWRCSATALQVRPFWGRAFGYYGAALLALYLAGATLAFTGLWLTGVRRIAWWQVAWPGAWHEIPRAQSQRFFDRAIEAFRHGRINDAYVSLSSASDRDPANYDAALMLAQIAMYQGSASHSDEAFQRLMREAPAKLDRTAITYHDTLLALNRPGQLAAHCLAMARRGSPRTARWVRSLLLAVETGRCAQEFSAQNREGIAALAPHARLLLQAVVLQQEGRLPEAKKLLKEPFDGPYNVTYLVQQIDLLLQMGETDAAGTLLGHYATVLPAMETAMVQYWISSAAGDETLALVDFNNLLQLPPDATLVDVAAAALIKYPSHACFGRLQGRLLPDADRTAAFTAGPVWAAALACGEPVAAQDWAGRAQRATGEGFPQIRRIDFGSAELANPASVPHLINAVTLPREVIHALLTRMQTPAPTSRR